MQMLIQSTNSEAFASELVENIEEIFRCTYVHSNRSLSV